MWCYCSERIGWTEIYRVLHGDESHDGRSVCGRLLRPIQLGFAITLTTEAVAEEPIDWR
jgi:hypothetical protein